MGFDFTYMFANNLEKMDHFYTDLLNLNLIHKDETTIAYKIDKHQLLISLDKNAVVGTAEFAIQPGWEGGTVARTSWSIEVAAEQFVAVVENLQADSTVKTWNNEPKWIGYWSFPVLDPMNQTLEITCTQELLS